MTDEERKRIAHLLRGGKANVKVEVDALPLQGYKATLTYPDGTIEHKSGYFNGVLGGLTIATRPVLTDEQQAVYERLVPLVEKRLQDAQDLPGFAALKLGECPELFDYSRASDTLIENVRDDMREVIAALDFLLQDHGYRAHMFKSYNVPPELRTIYAVRRGEDEPRLFRKLSAQFTSSNRA